MKAIMVLKEVLKELRKDEITLSEKIVDAQNRLNNLQREIALLQADIADIEDAIEDLKN